MPDRLLNNEFIAFMSKIIIPALITSAVAIAVDVKNDVSKVSWLTILMSIIIGTGGAYLAGGMLMEKLEGGQLTIAVSITTLLTEKTFKFFIHRFKVDIFLLQIIDAFFGTKLTDKTRSK